MGGARGRRQADRNGARLSLQAEVLVIHHPELRRRQLTAIWNFLVTLGSRVGESPTSDVGVGGGAARVAGLEGLMGPLEAAVVRVIWAANALSAQHVLRKLPETDLARIHRGVQKENEKIPPHARTAFGSRSTSTPGR
jgi:hypothetical protein